MENVCELSLKGLPIPADGDLDDEGIMIVPTPKLTLFTTYRCRLHTPVCQYLPRDWPYRNIKSIPLLVIAYNYFVGKRNPINYPKCHYPTFVDRYMAITLDR